MGHRHLPRDPAGYVPAAPAEAEQEETTAAAPPQQPADAHLRSCNELKGYQLHASDGDIGHVDDMLVEDRTWAIRYLVVNTSKWWGGHRVLVSPQWVDAVSWADSNVTVGLTRTAVQKAPEYDPDKPLDHQLEQAIFEHYGRPPYWTPLAPKEMEQLLGK